MYILHKENINVFRKYIKVWTQPSLTLFWYLYYCFWIDFTYSGDLIVEFERVSAVSKIFFIDKYKIHFFKGQNHIDKIFFAFRKKKKEKKLENLAKNGLFHFVEIFHFKT